jgi:PAS domain S-box-containing protein
VRDVLARIGTTVAIIITATGWYANWLADQRHLAKLEAMSEREVAEAAVRDSTDIGYVIVNYDGEIVEFNPAMVRFTGLEDAIGRKLIEIIPEHMRETHLAYFRKAMAEAYKLQHKESKVKHSPKAKVIYCDLPNLRTGKSTRMRIGVTIVTPQDERYRPYVVAKVYRPADVEILGKQTPEEALTTAKGAML